MNKSCLRQHLVIFRIFFKRLPKFETKISLVEALFNLILFLQVVLLIALPEDVDDWILPDNIGKAPGKKPKNSIDSWNIGDDITLKPLVIECVTWVFAVSNMDRPAVAYQGESHLVKRNHQVKPND